MSVIRIEIKEGFAYESVCEAQVVVLLAKEGFGLGIEAQGLLELPGAG